MKIKLHNAVRKKMSFIRLIVNHLDMKKDNMSDDVNKKRDSLESLKFLSTAVGQ